MKKADLWMPLYVADYLADTMHLNTEQHGAYCLLLMAAWKSGGRLKNEDEGLASITRLSHQKWQAHKDKLLKFFQVDGEWVSHKRVLIEIANAKANSNKRSKAGSKGAASRWHADGKRIAQAAARASQNDGPSPSPSFTTFASEIQPSQGEGVSGDSHG